MEELLKKAGDLVHDMTVEERNALTLSQVKRERDIKSLLRGNVSKFNTRKTKSRELQDKFFGRYKFTVTETKLLRELFKLKDDKHEKLREKIGCQSKMALKTLVSRTNKKINSYPHLRGIFIIKSKHGIYQLFTSK